MSEAQQAKTGLFLSYNFVDLEFVSHVYYLLSKHPLLDLHFLDKAPSETTFSREISDSLDKVAVVVVFLGATLGHYQSLEIQAADKLKREVHLVQLGASMPEGSSIWISFGKPITLRSVDPMERVRECAQRIVRAVELDWVPDDDVPLTYLFDYEKDLIRQYTGGSVSADLVRKGAPDGWPSVKRKEGRRHVELPREVGEARDEDARIRVDGRAMRGSSTLTFPEAGPRHAHRYPRPDRPLKVGVLVSGGVAPGTNAVIAGLVDRHSLYARGAPSCEMIGYREGFQGLVGDVAHMTLDPATAQEVCQRGGSVLGTSRLPGLLDRTRSRTELLPSIVNKLVGDHIQVLYIIGGDGSMRAAHAIATFAEEKNLDISVVGIPKTMDNDILWIWQSFGFLSSVDRAKDFILDLHTEVRSNPRLCVVQLFGSDSGFVVAHVALATRVCSAVLVPEVGFRLDKLSAYVTGRLVEARYRREMPHGLVLMAETAIPTDAVEYLDDPDVALTGPERHAVEEFLVDRRVRGQTPDELRSAGMKMVTRVLNRSIGEVARDGDTYWRSFRVFSNEPRHLIRAIAPSTSDVIFGQRLGALAVDAAMAGYTDCMVSQWLTEYVLVPLKLVVLGRKRLPEEGIFWRSVLASTGQPDFA